jgi:hypothetical protein
MMGDTATNAGTPGPHRIAASSAQDIRSFETRTQGRAAGRSVRIICMCKRLPWRIMVSLMACPG